VTYETALVSDIIPGPQSSQPADLTAAGKLLFFTADDGVHGRELWRSDGSVAGTFRLTGIDSGVNCSFVDDLTAVGSTVFFAATNVDTGQELWMSDGSTNGT
jgi:ELWxxDGT repeat protein